MRRSQRVRLSEVRQVFRVLGDARELRYDQTQQELMIVDAMAELLDASFGYAMRFGEFRPEAPTHLQRLLPGTTQDPLVVDYLSQWGKRSQFTDDPLMHATWGQAGPVYTTSMLRVMAYERLQKYRIYDEMVEPAGMRDVLITFFRYPGSNVTRGYTFQRTLKQKEYGPREHRMAHLFSRELYRLYQQGVLEPTGLLDTLPPRLARLARLLMTDQNQREIADSQSLSYSTVRSYAKELYDIAGVNSRDGLTALIRNQCN